MHPFFEPLSDREAMLLLTTLLVGGSDDIGLFAHLGPESSQRLQNKAQAMLEIASEARVPFMAKQMKQALSTKGLRGVERVDPSWLLQGMRGESPRTVAAILIGLPPPVVRSILKRLPSGIRKNLPAKHELQDIDPDLINAVRQAFESRFHVMPRALGKVFSFRDIIHLERRELFRLMRDLGLVELGLAFVAVGKLALAELCRRLPRTKAEELIMSVRRASAADAPDLKTAQRFLSHVVVNFDDTEEFFRKAGLWRVAKACLIEGEGFREAFRQRMPRDAGELFHGYIEKAGSMEGLDEEGLQRLQDAIILRVQKLSEAETLSPRWAQLDFVLHDPSYAERAAAAEAPPEPAPPPVEEAGSEAPPDDGPPPE